ncbi:Protein of unknown function [Lachnospiraceae bacterium XPB1003]|nr:Protein of unknown function [Lachnospiraceae bacterium XPB1003]
MKNKLMNLDPKFTCFLIAGAVLLYLISPVDLIPDFIVGLGQLDDAIMTTAGTIFEVYSIYKLITQNRVPKTAKPGAQKYEYSEDIGYADYKEI